MRSFIFGDYIFLRDIIYVNSTSSNNIDFYTDEKYLSLSLTERSKLDYLSNFAKEFDIDIVISRENLCLCAHLLLNNIFSGEFKDKFLEMMELSAQIEIGENAIGKLEFNFLF